MKVSSSEAVIPELDTLFNISSPSRKDVSKGGTTRIKGIASNIVMSSPLGTVFEGDRLALKVQSIIGELDMPYFYEVYDSRPLHTKGVTQVEYLMKALEIDGIVQRVGSRRWQRIS